MPGTTDSIAPPLKSRGFYTALNGEDEHLLINDFRKLAQLLGGIQGDMKFFTLRAMQRYKADVRAMSKEEKRQESQYFNENRLGRLSFKEIPPH